MSPVRGVVVSALVAVVPALALRTARIPLVEHLIRAARPVAAPAVDPGRAGFHPVRTAGHRRAAHRGTGLVRARGHPDI